MSVLRFIRRLLGYNQDNYDFGPKDEQLEQEALQAKQENVS
jgi:hypothetical protein